MVGFVEHCLESYIGGSGERPSNWSLQLGLVTHHPSVWAKFLLWRSSPDLKPSRLDARSSEMAQRLEDIERKLGSSFAELSHAVVRGHVTVGQLRQFLSADAHLGPVWAMLDSPLRRAHPHAASGLEDLETTVNSYLAEADNLLLVLCALMPDSDEVERLRGYMAQWDALPLNSIRTFLEVPLPEGASHPCSSFLTHHGSAAFEAMTATASVAPFPPVLLEDLNWFLACINDGRSLFREFFRIEWKGELAGIPDVVASWTALAQGFASGGVCFRQLELYAELMLHKPEIVTLIWYFLRY
jgi:hypothetical protein